ncbi:MAG: helix-turn-helix transcriptional regulator [Planctomycetes bacterium]|nr:helix-turn-helix transcriptional regulator [Planctomycetota bacterium]
MSIVEHELNETKVLASPHAWPELSQREMSVLTYLVQGYSHKEIADTIGVAAGTVNVFVHRIRQKTKARSRRELILAAAQYGIHHPDDRADNHPRHEPDLQFVEEAWPKVPDSVRAAILSLVHAVSSIGDTTAVSR